MIIIKDLHVFSKFISTPWLNLEVVRKTILTLNVYLQKKSKAKITPTIY